MGCASSAPSLSHNGELKSAADNLIQEGTDLASKAKKSATDLLDAAGDAKDDALAKLQGSFEGLYGTAKLPLGHIRARETHNDVGDPETASGSTERGLTVAESDLGDTEHNLAETVNDLGDTENDLVETVKDLGDCEPVKEQDIPEIVLEDMEELGAGDAVKEKIGSAAEMAEEKMDETKDAVQTAVEGVKAKIDNLMPSSEEGDENTGEGDASEEDGETETPAAAGEGDEQTEDAEPVAEEDNEEVSGSETAPANEGEEEEEGGEDEKEGETEQGTEEEKAEAEDSEENKEDEDNTSD